MVVTLAVRKGLPDNPGSGGEIENEPTASAPRDPRRS